MNIPNFICISKYIITYTYNMSSFDKKHDTCIVTGRYLQRRYSYTFYSSPPGARGIPEKKCAQTLIYAKNMDGFQSIRLVIYYRRNLRSNLRRNYGVEFYSR